MSINKNNVPQEVVQAFAQRHGITDLVRGAFGTAALRFPEGIEICLEEARTNGKLFVYLELGSLPAGEARIACLERLLKLNCLEQGTSCGTLAIDEATDTVLLQAGLPLCDLSVPSLEQAMAALLLHRPRLAASLHEQDDSVQEKKKAPSTAARLGWPRMSLGTAA